MELSTTNQYRTYFLLIMTMCVCAYVRVEETEEKIGTTQQLWKSEPKLRQVGQTHANVYISCKN